MVAYPGEAVYEFADGATWRSGYATVCKTVYSGSIPDVASTFDINGLERFINSVPRAKYDATDTVRTPLHLHPPDRG